MVLHRRCTGKLKTFVSRDELKECLTTCGAALTETLAEDVDYEKTFPLAGIDGPQRVELGMHRTRTLTLDRLIKCDNPSAFPALRQDRGIRKVRRGFSPRREKPTGESAPLISRPPFR